MNILITGATGFVGQHLVKSLLAQKGLNIYCLVRDVTRSASFFNSNKIVYLSLDRMAGLSNIDCDIVIHLASYLSSANDRDTSAKLLESNIIFGSQLLSYLKENKQVKFFMNFGTFAEYRLGPMDVDNAYLYSTTKTAFKQLLAYYADLCSWKYIHVIPYTIYGGEYKQKKIIDLLIHSFDAEQPIKLTKGEQILDFIHINDVLSFVEYVLSNINRFILDSRIDYHLGTGKGTSIKQLSMMLENKYNRKCNINWGGIEYRERDVMYAVAPIAPLLEKGWRPCCNLEEFI